MPKDATYLMTAKTLTTLKRNCLDLLSALVGENNLLVEDYEHSHYKILPSSISNITERAR